MARIGIKQLKDPVVLIAAGLGSGLAPKAPGTAGTVVAIPLCLVMQSLPLATYVLITALLFAFGVWVCAYTANKLGVHDHPSIVIDEIVGFLITMAAVPSGWLWVVIGFVLFRLFDALKPWPISWFDRVVTGGFGIMLDDVIAGLFSLAILHGLNYFQLL